MYIFRIIFNLDNTSYNLGLEFYKDDNLLQNIKLDKMRSYDISLNVDSNGGYNTKH